MKAVEPALLQPEAEAPVARRDAGVGVGSQHAVVPRDLLLLAVANATAAGAPKREPVRRAAVAERASVDRDAVVEPVEGAEREERASAGGAAIDRDVLDEPVGRGSAGRHDSSGVGGER